MSSLAENFMKDLEELGEDEKKNEENKNSDLENQNEIKEAPKIGTDITPLKYEQVSKLLSSKEYIDHIKAIDDQQNEQYDEKRLRNMTQNDPLYQLLSNSNKLLLSIESEIPVMHKYLRDIYAAKFPELENLIPSSVEYAKVVKRLGNSDELPSVPLNDILPNNARISVTVASSHTKGRPLNENEEKEVQKVCNDILELDAGRTKILKFMEQRMQLLAPNVCNIVGPSIAAKLVAAAGGISELAKMPACNIQVLGAQRKALHGMSSAGAGLHRGFIAESDLVRIAPDPLKINIIRMLSTKTALAARADFCGTTNNGEIGKNLKAQIVDRFKRIQEPRAPKLKRPLPKPEDKPKKHRAGKRLTAFRRRVQMTEYRKYANRMSFGPDAQQEYRETGKTFGMLGVAGSGKVKIKAQRDQKILKKVAEKDDKNKIKGATGLTSSLVFTPVQGMQLYNPEYIANQIKEQKETYFSSKAGFSTVTNMKRSSGASNIIL